MIYLEYSLKPDILEQIFDPCNLDLWQFFLIISIHCTTFILNYSTNFHWIWSINLWDILIRAQNHPFWNSYLTAVTLTLNWFFWLLHLALLLFILSHPTKCLWNQSKTSSNILIKAKNQPFLMIFWPPWPWLFMNLSDYQS